MNPRQMERLAGVDVADPDHHARIEQERLDRTSPSPGGAGEHPGVELLIQRLDAQMAKVRVVLEAGGW